MGGKFLISEEERRHIKKLYGLLTEAVEPYTQSQRVTFEPGYYGEKYAAPFLNPIIENIKKYLSDRPGERFVVNVAISSGESQIPNTDNEGAITGKAGTPLNPKALATQRGITIRDYLNTKLGELVKSGLLPSLPQYTIADPIIGGTPWVGTPFCPAGSTDAQQRSVCKDRYKAGKTSTYKDYFNAYQQEQYLDMSITIVEEPKTTTPIVTPSITPTLTTKLEECPSSIRIRFEVSKHSCQNAEFFVFANETRLNNMDGGMTANLNTGTNDRGIPNVGSNPIFPAELMNPGYGVLTQKYGVNVKGKSKEQLDTEFKGAARWDDFAISESQKEAILSQSIGPTNNTPFMNIWFVCTTDDAHDDIVTISIYGSSDTPLVSFKPTGKNQGLLCTLDKCGKPIATINDGIGPSGGASRKARQELIAYKTSLMNNLGLSGDISNLDSKGLSLERAGALLKNINEVVAKFEETYSKIQESMKSFGNKKWESLTTTQREPITTLFKSFDEFRKNKLSQYFDLSFQSEAYKELLRKNPEDPNSYPRGIMKSDMGGDLKARMDNFYKYFNLFYKINNQGGLSSNFISQSPSGYNKINTELSNIKG